ncbi:hypothetical protein [Nocardioides sp.]|uniref:hypothetical protein n=1 Tax=Nocardioides sp. TaxID=35761 RepID=UPI00271E996A|nr:hypothetical protein [Nocardioides sp.]MDO9455264.1 hypothetical protein [Nocardioides sp.]
MTTPGTHEHHGSGLELSDQESLLLLLVHEGARTGVEEFPLDRVRVQKAGFLLSMRGPARWRQTFNYRPYDWGPYSDDLAFQVRHLEAEKLIRVSPTGGRYAAHVATKVGELIADMLWMELSPVDRAFVQQVRSYVTTRSFRQLLTEVYAAYPDYATHSKFVRQS